jgi:disulfide oxidoreductase YuzD
MHKIEIYGFAEQELCAGCDHCGSEDCKPGAKQATSKLVAEFKSLLVKENFPAEVFFYEATEENIAKNDDVKKILSMAELAPAIVLDGKLLFLGGFSPEGLLEEIRKRAQ